MSSTSAQHHHAARRALMQQCITAPDTIADLLLYLLSQTQQLQHAVATLARDTNNCMDGCCPGTPDYMPLEQLDGKTTKFLQDLLHLSKEP